jgi:hypothetical protein
LAKHGERGSQGTLFGEIGRRSRAARAQKKRPEQTTSTSADKWRMPESKGSTIASVRLLWMKRLTPAQVSQVEAEIAALPRMLTNLGFGSVVLERSSIRRKRK